MAAAKAGKTGKTFIVRPVDAQFPEEKAAQDLAKYLKQMTGATASLVGPDAVTELAADCTYILIGPPGRNSLTARLVSGGCLAAMKKMPQNEDGFVIANEKIGRARVLALAGARPIASLYAAYEYLERSGVGFFQDGEYVPRVKKMPVCNLVTAPRFKNRLHTAWIAHNSIKKYFSHYWTLDEWKREFDWMAKRHMNMCSGMNLCYYNRFAGDAFMQAFPEIGPEPYDRMYPRMGGWTVEVGWPPEKQREQTQKMLEYGRSVGVRFIYGMDYATVPFRFKDIHPEYKYMPGNQYGESRQIDPHDPGAYEVEKRYLTKIIELFGTDHYYMYSPYGEIDVGGGDPEKNLEMRITACKSIMKLIADVDPEGIWVTDSWDMISKRRWNQERVERYIKSFPNKGVYFYETAADIAEPKMYKTYDGWYGKEWAFGLLHSFAGEDALHGDPADLVERLQEAADYPNCTGVFMVPEMTHHNIMFWDLATHLAWQPKEIRFDEFVKNYVSRRYGQENVKAMLPAWEKIIRAVYWYKDRPTDYVLMRMCSPHFPWYQWTGNWDGNNNLISCPFFPKCEANFYEQMADFNRELPLLRDALGIMLKQKAKLKKNPLYVEDLVVVFRALAGKTFNQQAGLAYLAWKAMDMQAFKAARPKAMKIMTWIQDVLSVIPSYSINRTIAEARSVKGSNKLIPEMIRNNSINGDYINQDVYEQFPGQYIPRMTAYFDLLEKKIAEKDKHLEYAELQPVFKKIDDRYRMKGWSGPVKKGDPVEKVARYFPKITALHCL